MKKKLILQLILFMFLLYNFTFAQEKYLSYGDFLYLYFGAIDSKLPIEGEGIKLQYINIENTNKLYKILQKAVANKKFPNLELELPLNKIATEDELASLIKNNFNITISYTSDTKLTFDFLKTTLETVYKQLGSNKVLEKNNIKIEADSWKNKEIDNTILSLLKKNYIYNDELKGKKNLSSNETIEEFVNGLGEDYTKYYSPSEGEELINELNSSFVGIGVYIEKEVGKNPIIQKVIEYSPAEKAGLKAGDEFHAIDGKGIGEFKTYEEFISSLRGEAGSNITIQVKRGKQYISANLKRELIRVPLIESKREGGLCYIRIVSFDIGSYNEFGEKIKEIGTCDSYVFDVRSNPGGVIDEVVNILDEFIPKGKTILTVNTVNNKEIITATKNAKIILNKPTAIIMDKYTASAAEIFAGALRHYYPNSVKLVGDKSYGKGSVQQIVEFSNHAIVKYTMAFWNIADEENNIDGIGLSPDIYMQDNPKTMKDEILETLGLGE